MEYKKFKLARIGIAFFIAITVAIASSIDNFHLAILSVLIGILFMYLVRIKYRKVIVDERVISVAGRASRLTYVIVTMFLAFLSLFLIFNGKSQGQIYMEVLGVVFSYVAMLNIAIYAVSFHFFNKKYGGDKE